VQRSNGEIFIAEVHNSVVALSTYSDYRTFTNAAVSFKAQCLRASIHDNDL